MRTKWLPLLLIVALLSTLAVGCGNSAEQNEPVNQNEQTPIVDKVTIEDVAVEYFAKMPDHIYKIDEPDLKARVDANDDTMLILDIRAPEDYAKGHIKGAVNVPFAAVHEYLDKLPADKEIIVYCYTGQTAGQAVAILNMYGYNARSLHLGYKLGWVEAQNFPSVTEVAELPANVTPAKPDPEIAKILKDYFANLPEDKHIIANADVLKAIEEGKDVQIIDIRGEEAYKEGHIKGAIHIPFRNVHEHFDEIAKDKPVYVVCVTGQTAGQTVAVLNTLGIDASSIKSGMNLGWNAENLPLEK